ncbi:type II secretion system F family protein [Myceligenerans xiligouense]|uniref:Flp pilus assembly protein TadB n=1 Tax=Myceligenerans xiligouense TaxID=253184 RepID=A0A3N4Z6M3_9MICO|nr:type II secretion system F family protein [Myceligenerans xiligouense]RPF21468.1 Flp pilus assembly protein TadB [Myceligenerans xiligouense]
MPVFQVGPALGSTVAGTLITFGAFALVAGWRGWALLPDAVSPAARRRLARFARITRRTWTLLGLGVLTGLVVWAIWKWPVAVIAVPAAVVGLPALLSNRGQVDAIARLEALEEWTRSLAGVLTIGQGLEQALTVAQRSAPPAIAEPVDRLVSRLTARWDTETALRAFADDLDDATSDHMTIYLLQAAQRRGTGLAKVLDELATTVAAEVRARRQIEADRARPRATARWVTIISATVLGFMAFTGDYIAPYQTPLGQVLLVVLVGAYLAALVWMKRIAAGKPRPRSLGEQVRREAARQHATALAGTPGGAP